MVSITLHIGEQEINLLELGQTRYVSVPDLIKILEWANVQYPAASDNGTAPVPIQNR